MSSVELRPEVRADLVAAIRMGRSAPAAADRAALADLLYTAWFTRFTPAPAPAATSLGTDGEPRAPSLVARLRAAHAATPRFERGWSARAVVRPATVLAERAGDSREVVPPDYVNLTRPAAPVRVGDRLAITARRERGHPQDGWWMTYAAGGPTSAEGLVRVYWNCPVGAITTLVAGVTRVLEGMGVPYSLKCPATDELFDRLDSVVLYLGNAEWSLARDSLRELHSSLAPRLRDPVPPLTLRLGRGAAAAEDPADGGSFGESRVRAVADGLMAAVERGVSDEREVLAIVVDRLVAHGICAARPHQRAESPPNLVTAW